MAPQPAMRPCRVIVVGGGVAGLALALMLEKNGVDYVLLEAYDEVVAQATAGICMVPNGLRILDQLGCYEDLMSHVQDAIDTMDFRGPNGELVASVKEMESISINRYGYPVIWVERPALLQAMYDQVSDKSKLLAKKRVSAVQHLVNAVQVETEDGSTYHGDFVIGADGTHSRVRQEMVRHATELGVGEDYDEDDKIPTTYASMLGVSELVPGIPRGYMSFGFNKQHSYIVGTGTGDRTYWLLTKNLGKTLYGAEAGSVTGADQERIAQEYGNELLTPEVRFSDLYQRRKRVIYTPVPEFVYQKWHLDRTIVLGEASYKMSPVLAQGANQAIESAAAMVNSLMAVLSHPIPGRISMDEIRTMFEEVQQVRQPRVQQMVQASHARQTADALETPEIEHVMLNQFHKQVPEIVWERWNASYRPAVSLKMMEIPARPRGVPYDDEAPHSTTGI
ncbi:hypothetical protein BDW59DRAFT_151644 [Aspergillus cavernicola]|uniref:FAD-binding domain-containing protein n=1 Tax=Aspergillus cavernicola TaxID=176166 RepID=A0ABR4HU83_9EURO